VVAGRVVPSARTYRRRSPAAGAMPEHLERVAADGWRAVETATLGEWLLRAAGGFTGRANSALAVGDPGVGTDTALAHVRDWYEQRGLVPRLQVVAGSTLDRDVEARGWRVPGSGLHGSPVLVQTAMAADVLEALGPADAGTATRVEREPNEEWLTLCRGGTVLSPAAREVLTGHPLAAFASRGSPVFAIGRIAVDRPWCGLFALEVADGFQRRGHARATVRALLEWATQQGADRVYSQVSAGNAPGLAFHARLGFAWHHEYVYRLPPSFAT
jgi:N-acetylglutamate synthase